VHALVIARITRNLGTKNMPSVGTECRYPVCGKLHWRTVKGKGVQNLKKEKRGVNTHWGFTVNGRGSNRLLTKRAWSMGEENTGSSQHAGCQKRMKPWAKK